MSETLKSIFEGPKAKPGFAKRIDIGEEQPVKKKALPMTDIHTTSDGTYVDKLHDSAPSIPEAAKPAKKRRRNKKDNVNHPAHYSRGSIEVIDFIEDQGLQNNLYLASALKYIVRAGYKSKKTLVEDLQKAAWHIDRAIKQQLQK